jgi:hypothetical protein
MIQLSVHSTINRSTTYNYSSDHDDDDDGGAEAGLLAAAALRRVPHVHGVRHATQQRVVAYRVRTEFRETLAVRTVHSVSGAVTYEPSLWACRCKAVEKSPAVTD